MKSLFFGTSAFALPSLHVLAGKTDVVGVVTQPDRPAGRGHKLTPTPVKAAALELGLRVYEPERLRPFVAEIQGAEIEIFALASYGRILPQLLLDLPSRGALNVHPSLLPKYRGATPIQTALRDGAQVTGVSIMLMDAGMDTGDLVAQETVAIGESESYGTLHDRLAQRGAGLLGEVLDRARIGALPRTPQSGEPSVTRPVSGEQLTIDWSWSTERIVNTVRAYAPQPAARAQLFGETVKLLSVRAAQDASPAQLVVPCGDGLLLIEEVIAPNRGRESGQALLARERARAVNR